VGNINQLIKLSGLYVNVYSITNIYFLRPILNDILDSIKKYYEYLIFWKYSSRRIKQYRIWYYL